MVTKHKMKNTEIGFIPEDWDICSIDNEFAFLKSNSLSREQLNYTHGSVANIHYGDILTKLGENIDIKRTQLPLINHSAEFTPSPKDLLKTGDVILADTAEDETAGKACEVIGITNESIVAGLHTIAMRSKQIHFAPGYLGYTLNASYYHDQLRPLMQGTKVISISKKALQETSIIYPRDINEQRAIVNVLTDIDTIIARLKEAIEKKMQIKEGAMQRLLTGKVRLRGFKEPWVELELGNIGKLTGAGVDKTINEEETRVKLLNFLDVYNRDRIYPHELNMWVTASDYKISQCDIRKGDIFLTPSSELPDDIGRSAVAMADINDACYSYHILRLRPAIELDLVYSAYMLKTSAYEEQIRFLSEGSGKRYVISLRNFREIRISIPSDIGEQHAIGQVIAAMDNEISALEAEKNKYISIKQGMMQKLLTGQIRLPQSCLKEE